MSKRERPHRTVNLLGNPSVVAQEMERYEKYQKKREEGTGCAQCANSETAWQRTYCMIGEQHPRCVYRGRFRYRDPDDT